MVIIIWIIIIKAIPKNKVYLKDLTIIMIKIEPTQIKVDNLRKYILRSFVFLNSLEYNSWLKHLINILKDRSLSILKILDKAKRTKCGIMK